MLFGAVMGLAASASWAAANVFVQRSGRALGPPRALLWSQLCGGLAVLPAALALDSRPGSWDAATLAWTGVGAVAAVLAYASLFYATSRGRLSVVVPIMSSWSMVATAISVGLLGERVRAGQLGGTALVVAGVAIISRASHRETVPAGGAGDSSDRKQNDRLALLFAFGAMIGFGTLVPVLDRLRPVAGQIGVVPFVFLLDLIVGLPLVLAGRVDLSPPPRAAWPGVAAAGVLETAGFVWISLGIARAPVAVVSPLASLSSALTVLYAWVVLRERPPRAVLLGAALACGGVVALSL
jgi:drug/metabolite transporter (DMT)-like permease